jgi:hypothetical protein
MYRFRNFIVLELSYIRNKNYDKLFIKLASTDKGDSAGKKMKVQM